MSIRAESRVDRSTASLAVERSKRDGVVHLRVPLTWIGVRTYRDPETGKLSRELRRPEQVWSTSHIETLKRLTCTHGHPSEAWEGTELPVMLDARADATSGPGEDGTLRRPAQAGLQVGQVGDLIEKVEIAGAPLPVAGVAIHGSAAIADIEVGNTQTSLGYGCLVDRTPGTWTDSSGRAWEYDAEHVLDVTDPRVAAAAAEGFDPLTLGANHLAVGIARGRGGPMSELLPRLDSALAWEVVADGVVWNPNAGPTGAAAPSLTEADPRLLAAMESAGVASSTQGLVPVEVITAVMTGFYGGWASKWRGWIEHGNGIAFVPADAGKSLWWAERTTSGAVIGEPVAFTYIGPASRVDAAEPLIRSDLGEPRLFTTIRNGDESGVSGTGRVMDGVLWPDGTVAIRWRTVTASSTSFDSWTDFHRVHICAHPDNNSELPFADGGEAPSCIACLAREAVTSIRTDDAAAAAAGYVEGAPYPPRVRTLSLPARAKDLADKIATSLAGKVSVKTDGLELNLPPEMAGPVADVLMAMAEQIRGMSTDLATADAALGTQAAEMAMAKEEALKMQADAALVAPLLADARKAKRDALLVEAAKVAGGRFDVAADADEFAVKRAAVKQRLGDGFKRDSVDAIEATYSALLIAGSSTQAPTVIPTQAPVIEPVLAQTRTDATQPVANPLYSDG